MIDFETHPSKYERIQLSIDASIATLKLAIPEKAGLKKDYLLKLNSYDLSVDIELADAISRLRFEHPEVSCVIITSSLDNAFCSGANIFMLGASTHSFKVNFCKFTNETRLYIEDATENSGQTYIAAINGVCSGGGYELALACKEIYLIDDRKSSVALPEVPYLGVLPGTGGLTRLVDKREIPHDRADVFCTLAEGFKGKRAKKWGLVDDIFPKSKFNESILQKAQKHRKDNRAERKGILLEPLNPNIMDEGIDYKYIHLSFGPISRTATLRIEVPDKIENYSDPKAHSSSWYPLQVYRELDDLLCRLRFNYNEIGLVLIKTTGNPETILKADQQLYDAIQKEDWLAKEIVLLMKRVLKRLDVTAKSFFAIIEQKSCFVGNLLELVFCADRSYMLANKDIYIALSPLNRGYLPMANGQSRLKRRFLSNFDKLEDIKETPTKYDYEEAEEKGLITMAIDLLDWEDEIRLVTEERICLSPDALTGMEASLRFAGHETLETKIFGRLSAWQNWIFQRPNAVGEKGALTLYGDPQTPKFDWSRT